MAIDKVLVPSTNYNLARDGDLGTVLVAKRRAGAVGVVEDDGDGGLGDAGLALLVDELLERGSAHLAEVGDAEHEADGVEDVGLAGAVEPGNGVEQRVEPRHHRTPRVRLEPLQGYLLDVHLTGRRWRRRSEMELGFGGSGREIFRGVGAVRCRPFGGWMGISK
uniref:Uncharacterized protein n=1 Tax=Arundo donax TaxID=35708 RepID=A0A0A9F103_ARUDO